MMNLPISYVLLRLGFASESVFVTAIIISQCCLFARLFMLRNMIKLNVSVYLGKVYVNIFVVTLCAILLPLFFKVCVWDSVSLLQFVLLSMMSLICSAMAILFIGCNKEERILIKKKIETLKRVRKK